MPADTLVFKNALVLLGTSTAAPANDITAQVRRVRLTRAYDIHDVSSMGTSAHVRITGLEDWSGEMEMYNVFTTSGGAVNIDNLLNGITAAGKAVSVQIRPTTSTQSATNPTYDGLVVLEGYAPFDAEVGTPLTTRVGFRSASAINRLTTGTS